MHFQQGTALSSRHSDYDMSKLLRIDAHKPKLFGLNSKKVKI